MIIKRTLCALLPTKKTFLGTNIESKLSKKYFLTIIKPCKGINILWKASKKLNQKSIQLRPYSTLLPPKSSFLGVYPENKST